MMLMLTRKNYEILSKLQFKILMLINARLQKCSEYHTYPGEASLHKNYVTVINILHWTYNKQLLRNKEVTRKRYNFC